jgi:drug/metabolite transporter (DMT)-like permease
MSVFVVFVLIVALRQSPKPAIGTTKWLVSIGVLNGLANVALLAALNRGHLSLASVLSSLYPVTTIGLASVILRERMRPSQVIGLTGAMATIVLVVAG